jgi:UDP-hydrolysing UDP-N-acetyl-D-glucosamine 2-epimerase
MTRRVAVVVTARPSYSRIKTVLHALAAHPDVELQLVVAASALLDRYGTAVRYVEEDGFAIAARVHMVLEGATPTIMAKTTGLGLLELATTFDHLCPDVVVTIADRYETMATAVAAAYMNLPLAHVQGGEVTGSIDEKVRHAVTKLADLHLVATRRAAQRVTCMGEDPASIFLTGCPSIDLAAEVLAETDGAFDPFERYGGVGDVGGVGALRGGYVVVLQHPVTTEFASAREHVLETLHAMRAIDLPKLWFWPNVDAGSDGTSNGIRTFRESGCASGFHFFKGMAPHDFLRLLHRAACLVGNSSAGIRECSFLGVPVVNVGSRQAGRDRARNVCDVEHERAAIAEATRTQVAAGHFASDHLYGDGHAGVRAADVLAAAPLHVTKRLSY